MNNPNETASKKYKYDTIYFNKPLYDCVPIVHNNVDLINNWKKFDIKKYTYGYDNYIYVLSKVLPKIKQNKDDLFIYIGNQLSLDKYGKIAFKAHIKNYLYWRNNIPYDGNPIYEKPSKAKKRSENFSDELALCTWEALDSCQKDIYIDIVKSVFDYLKQVIITEGIQNLSI